MVINLWGVALAEPVMADKPLLAIVITEQLGTGHEEHTPAHPPFLGKVISIGLFDRGLDLRSMGIHIRQPGIGGFFIVGAVPAPMLLQFQVILKMHR